MQKSKFILFILIFFTLLGSNPLSQNFFINAHTRLEREKDELSINSHSYSQPQYQTQSEILKQLKTIPYTRSSFSRTVRRFPLVSAFFSVFPGNCSTKEFLKYDFHDIKFKTEEGTTFQAKIYLSKSPSPRPLLVMVPGIGSTIKFHLWRKFAFPLAKKADYNIVLLENVTSSTWIRKNDTIHLSGYETGYQLYMVLKKIREHFAQRDIPFTKLHLAGFSLGGNDVAYALYFDSLLGTEFIDGSSSAWSAPGDRYMANKLIRLKTGIEKIVFMAMAAKSILVDDIYRRLSGHSYQWTFYKGKFDDVLKFFLTPRLKLFFKKNIHHLLPDPHFHNIIKCPFKDITIDNIDKITEKEARRFFQLNTFLDFVTKPLLWIHAKDDDIVNYEYTIPVIKKITQKHPMENIKTLVMPHGGHLGFSSAYGEKWVFQMLTQYIDYWE